MVDAYQQTDGQFIFQQTIKKSRKLQLFCYCQLRYQISGKMYSVLHGTK